MHTISQFLNRLYGYHNDVTTGEDGKAVLTGIPSDSYEVTEVSVPDPYVISDEPTQTIWLEAGDDKELIFDNLPQPTLKISKVEKGTETRIPGTVFTVEAINGDYRQDVTTGADGTVTLRVMPGSYRVTEKSVPEPYVVSDDPTQTISLNAGDEKELVFENLKKPLLRISKIEKNTGEKIPGTVFTVEAIDGDYRQDVTTGADGWVELRVAPGSYRVTEKSVPEPYVISDEPTQTISLNAGDEKELVFENLKKPLLRISKIEKNTGEKIPGTVFLLEAIDGDYRQNVTTGADGWVELRVASGSYRITEQSVPEPYVIGSERTKTISLNPGDEKEVTFENLKKPELTLSKIDADTQEPIPGTVLRVEAVNGDYQDDWSTGADGKVTKYVEPGVYRVTEISVPAPYYLPDRDADRVQTITLNPGDEKELVFRNRKSPELTIFKEDSVSGAPIEGVKFHVTYTSNGEAAEAPATIDFGHVFTDSHGEIKLHEQGKRLYPGEYTITEVAPAPGYQMKEPTTQKVIIHGNESKTVTFENTHEAIIDPETWKLAQHVRKTVRRTDTTGMANPLTGLMFCADCGAKMYNHREGARALKEGWQPDPVSGLYPSDHYSCSTYELTSRQSEQKCCSHYITTRAVRALILDTIRTVSAYAISDEKGFVEKIRTASQIQQDNAAKELKRKLNRDRKRHSELDGLIQRLYETFATGNLTEKRFKMLSDGYEQEQEELEAAIAQEQAELDAFNADTDKANQFLELVKRYTDFSVLTNQMILEFVDKIVVHAPDRSSGERTQEVDIYLKFIGKFDVPLPEPTPEELEEQEQLRKKREKQREYARRHREKKKRAEAQN